MYAKSTYSHRKENHKNFLAANQQSRCNVELKDEEKGIEYRKITNLNREINCNLVSDNEE